MMTLAHISDIHLAPLPKVQLRDLMSKRITGYLNWLLKRKSAMRRDTLSRLVAHLKDQNPDMTAITGDLVNLALPEETARAASWLAGLGPSESVCVIPGNHDAYVKDALDTALRTYGPYMSGETLDNTPFPFVRRQGQVAIIGVSSAIATAPFVAAGRLGQAQLERLERLLELLGDAGYCRVVLIHHPPNVESQTRRKGLWDAAQFRAVLAKKGAELVLHGHTHVSSIHSIPGKEGEIPVIGVASASASSHGHDAPGRYNLFKIEKSGSTWTCTMREYGYQRIGEDIALRLQMRIF